MTTSASRTASVVRILGPALAMSMPSSAMASTATGLILSAGSDPADRTVTLSPARCLRYPAAICERPALCTQTNRTVGLSVMARASRDPSTGGSTAGEPRTCGGDLVGQGCGVGVQEGDETQPERTGDELHEDEHGHRGRGDAGEGVGEHPGDRHGGVREAGRAGEPV